MAIPSKQIGWSEKFNLLWEVSRQLDRLLSVIGGQGNTVTNTTTVTTTICFNCVETPVVIGTQTWDRCNLNVTKYRNGDDIPEIQDSTAWENTTTGAWCHYDNNPDNEAIYGKLYNWYAVNDPRGLAPLGKHIPSETEWNILITSLGGESVAGNKMREVGTCHWESPNTGATNSSEFTAFGAGSRYNVEGNFSFIKQVGAFWSTTEISFDISSLAYLDFSIESALIIPENQGFGLSVRCLLD
jgi:uncharacterized protein (TIGR02145 family)